MSVVCQFIGWRTDVCVIVSCFVYNIITVQVISESYRLLVSRVEMMLDRSSEACLLLINVGSRLYMSVFCCLKWLR